MDRIVFNQHQLDEICDDGSISVVLCDNTFVLPTIGGRKYIALGDVTARIQLSPISAIKLGITFENFEPEFKEADAPAYANVEHGIRPLSWHLKRAGMKVGLNSSYPSSMAGSFSSSFATSFKTSFTAFFAGSFMTSFSGSFAGSFAGSFTELFVNSFPTSFKSPSSFAGSGSFVSAFMKRRKNYVVKEFAVNGYGINLI